MNFFKFQCQINRNFLLLPFMFYVLLPQQIHAKTIQDSTNLSITIQKENPKIISLSPYITEILFNLGCGKDILAVTSYCNRPTSAKFKQKIGGIIDPNTEAILALSPDVVFATKEDQSLEQIKMLRNLWVNVFVLKEVRSFEDIKQNFLLIADVVGERKAAERQLKDIQAKLEQIRKRNLSRKTRRIFFVLESDPLITVSRESFLNDMLAFVNTENVVKETSPRYPFYSKEKLLLLKPDLIIFIAKKETNKWKILKDLGIKTEKVFVDPDIFSRGNPTAFLEAVEILNRVSK